VSRRRAQAVREASIAGFEAGAPFVAPAAPDTEEDE